MAAAETDTLLEKLDASVPSSLKEFDAFPKLPSTYKTRSESRGFLTVFVAIAACFLLLNDFAEFIWGWPTYDFTVDQGSARHGHMKVNVDMVVNMPCGCKQSFICRIHSQLTSLDRPEC
jgi:endoplasmic reticulum-Golgi intermediate compartment protein 2